MFNTMALVGRLCADPTLKELEDNKKVCNITLAVPRPFKNANGEYETDFFPISIWNGIAENTAEYCKQGDLLGIKGRLQFKDNKISIIAEKVSFIASKSKNDDKEENKDIKM